MDIHLGMIVMMPYVSILKLVFFVQYFQTCCTFDVLSSYFKMSGTKSVCVNYIKHFKLNDTQLLRTSEIINMFINKLLPKHNIEYYIGK